MVGGGAGGRPPPGRGLHPAIRGPGHARERRPPLRAGVARQPEPQLLGIQQPGGLSAPRRCSSSSPAGRPPLPRVDLLCPFAASAHRSCSLASRDYGRPVGGGQPGKGLVGVAAPGPTRPRPPPPEVRPGYQAEQAEQLRRSAGARGVGRGRTRRGRRPQGRPRSPARPAGPHAERGHLRREAAAVHGQVGGGDPQRQRQERAGTGPARRPLRSARSAWRRRGGRAAPGASTASSGAEGQPLHRRGGDSARRSRLVTRTRQPGAAGEQRADLVGAARCRAGSASAARPSPTGTGRAGLLQVGRDRLAPRRARAAAGAAPRSGPQLDGVAA